MVFEFGGKDIAKFLGMLSLEQTFVLFREEFAFHSLLLILDPSLKASDLKWFFAEMVGKKKHTTT